MKKKPAVAVLSLLLVTLPLPAGVGDPQVRTNHPWYPGELACSTFERLFATQAKLYERVVGREPVSDHDKALASWLWRNTHFAHGEEGVEDLWGIGFGKGGDVRMREYWTGLFAHGFGLCGTTHSQWVAEMEALLGHGRGRGVGVSAHVTFEAFLKGGAYGKGRWALLDQDQSTVIFSKDGKRLLSMAEVQKNWRQLARRNNSPKRQNGWLVNGLHPDDGVTYRTYRVAEYLSGYSGPPPMVHLRRGEKLRRYFQPGLDDGKTFVYWGRNYKAGGIPGPERSRTWVNQPEKMYKSKTGTGHKPGQVRFANAVYIYQPNFTTGNYREGVIAESNTHVTFEFYTPYIIAATPPNDKPWGIYDKGCRNGLVLTGAAKCSVAVSVDRGASWINCGRFKSGMDLTDHVKGHRQYFLRLHTSAKNLRKSNLTIRTVCQANPSILPRLQDNATKITFQAGGSAIVSAGPNLPQVRRHVIAGKIGSPRVTIQLATPSNEPIQTIYAAAHVLSGNPPNPKTKFHIDFSIDSGKTWKSLIRDWTIKRRGNEPADFWSQSFCWGSLKLTTKNISKVSIRFRNSGGRRYARCEAHLVYRPKSHDGTKVTYSWMNNRGERRASQIFAGGDKTIGRALTWSIETGRNVQTRWVEFTPLFLRDS